MVKAFPRDDHKNDTTFGYYNITHLATFKENSRSPPQAIEGPKSLYPQPQFKKSGKEDGPMEGKKRLQKQLHQLPKAPISLSVSFGAGCRLPQTSSWGESKLSGGSRLLETNEAKLNMVVAGCPESRAAIPSLQPQPRTPYPPPPPRGFVHRNVGYSGNSIQTSVQQPEARTLCICCIILGCMGGERWCHKAAADVQRGTAQGKTSSFAPASLKHSICAKTQAFLFPSP